MPLQQRTKEDVTVCVVLRDKMRVGLYFNTDLATFKLLDIVDVAVKGVCE